MNLVADESVDGPIVERLRADGHSVLFVAESFAGSSDPDVLAIARERNALLLTADKDFGELVFRLNEAHAGVLLIRLAGIDSNSKAELTSAVIAGHGEELSNQFSVLNRQGLRIRI